MLLLNSINERIMLGITNTKQFEAFAGVPKGAAFAKLRTDSGTLFTTH
jgi:hypothetical protein